MAMGIRIEVWETDEDIWVWAIYECGREIAVAESGYLTRQSALDAARVYANRLG